MRPEAQVGPGNSDPPTSDAKKAAEINNHSPDLARLVGEDIDDAPRIFARSPNQVPAENALRAIQTRDRCLGSGLKFICCVRRKDAPRAHRRQQNPIEVLPESRHVHMPLFFTLNSAAGMAFQRAENCLLAGWATISWNRGGDPTGSIGTRAHECWLELIYQSNGEPIRDVVHYRRTRTNFGG